MFFTPVTRRTAFSRHAAFVPSVASFERLLHDAAWPGAPASKWVGQVAEDDASYTVSVDVPGVSREQLSIGIEGQVIRLQTLPQAPRQYQAVYELPQEIDPSQSEAKLENGVLTVRLAKVVPASKVTQLAIN